jgi:hypothetical protein
VNAIVFWLSIVGALVAVTGAWAFEARDFARLHARRRTAVLNAARLTACALVFWAALWIVPRSIVTAVLVAIEGALVYFPERWLIRLGGLEPRWQLRALQDAAGELANRYPAVPRPPEFAEPMARLISRMKAIQAHELAEMRDLLIADFAESISSVHHFPDLGLRAVRIHQLEAELFGPEARRAEFEPDEATFRWRLYRHLGDMIDCGSAARDLEHLVRLRELIDELEQYRRQDTEALIDAVASSAREWLACQAPGPWPPTSFRDIGLAIDRGYAELWSSKRVFWGAELDDRDWSALSAIVERKSSSSGRAG